MKLFSGLATLLGFSLGLLAGCGQPGSARRTEVLHPATTTVEAIQLFDEYRGEGVPPGTRSLAWRLTFRHPERTLRDKEIEGRRSALLKTLQKEIGVVARTN